MSPLKSKTIWLSLWMVLAAAALPSGLSAQETPAGSEVEYGQESAVDKDFDGLTDQGEEQIYKTDPLSPDTDGDGFFDGIEVLRNTDPNNPADPIDLMLSGQIGESLNTETPWAWYVTRSGGLIAFVFLWLSIFFGLAIRNELLKKIIRPVYSFGFHCFLGASALFWTVIHGGSIIFDKFFGMGVRDILIPFHFDYPGFISSGIDSLALGILAFYGMAIIVFTSYLKKFLSQRIWRILHFLNPVAFIFVVWHGYQIGTDMKIDVIRYLFLGSSGLLLVLYLSNLFFVLMKRKRAAGPEIEASGKGIKESL